MSVCVSTRESRGAGGGGGGGSINCTVDDRVQLHVTCILDRNS